MPRVKLFDQQKVLEKAMELFWEKGYHATSMQDLVDHLSINRASLYDTYGGKMELFLSSFEYYRRINITTAREFLFQYEKVKDGLRALFYMAIEQPGTPDDNKGCFVVNTTTELLPGDVEIEEIIRNNKMIFEQLFNEYLQYGVDKKQISRKKDIKSIATLLFTLYNGIKVLSKVKPEKEDMLRSVNTALSLLD